MSTVSPEPGAGTFAGAGSSGAAEFDLRDRSWGRRMHYQDDSRRKSPILAILLSVVPGLGQAYVGYYQQAFIHILTVGALLSLTIRDLRSLQPLAVTFLIFFWLFNLVDAGRRAALYNLALTGAGGIDLPDSVTMPGGHGSLAGGVTLIVVGFLVLGHTRFGYSLEWLEQWWPLALILMGAYLIGKALSGRKAAD